MSCFIPKELNYPTLRMRVISWVTGLFVNDLMIRHISYINMEPTNIGSDSNGGFPYYKDGERRVSYTEHADAYTHNALIYTHTHSHTHLVGLMSTR